MCNAFKPDQPITREQALAVKSSLDRGGVDKLYVLSAKQPGPTPNYGYYILPHWGISKASLRSMSASLQRAFKTTPETRAIRGDASIIFSALSAPLRCLSRSKR